MLLNFFRIILIGTRRCSYAEAKARIFANQTPSDWVVERGRPGDYRSGDGRARSACAVLDDGCCRKA